MDLYISAIFKLQQTNLAVSSAADDN
jgi:hypothetical protein